MIGATVLPKVDDPDSGPFWEAAGRRQLVFSRCSECRRVLHPPRALCDECGSENIDWVPTDGRGRVYAVVVVEHQVHPAFPVPYTLALVDVEGVPGFRLLATIPGRVGLGIGDAMTLTFEQRGAVTMPNWVPASGDSQGSAGDGGHRHDEGEGAPANG
jgi:uncharacterized OB-fold protein